MKTCNEIFSENREWAKGVFERIDAKMSHVTLRSRSKLPDGVDENGIHVCRDVTWWTNGFWGGLNWLLYNATGKEDYKLTALESEKLLDAAFLDFDNLHHDVGFMWHILSGASYRLTGDKKSRTRSLYAASILASRHVLGGGFIRAWNGDSKFYSDTANLTIIDTMMNLPLLYWASRETGDDRFSRVAMSHADNTLRTHIRPDGSVAHIVIHDRESGDKLDECGGQGYAVGSSWTRGQGWAIYGFAISYIHTGEARYLDAARRVADYFISELSDDHLVPLDFRAPKEPSYYDTTASAIAACGMLEIAKLLPDGEGAVYAECAVKLLRAMEEHFVSYDPGRDDMVRYGSVRYPSLDIDADGSTLAKIIHVSIIYGDFFFIEAILKLLGSDFNPW
jgi:unsaturated chondroitin disaccharide hydrolase